MLLDSNLSEAKEGKRISAKGYAVSHKSDTFKPYEFSRHPLGEKDILIEILYAGICHSDIHSARSEWKEGIYPMVPGHEIAGKVVAVGSKVSKFKPGDYAGVYMAGVHRVLLYGDSAGDSRVSSAERYQHHERGEPAGCPAEGAGKHAEVFRYPGERAGHEGLPGEERAVGAGREPGEGRVWLVGGDDFRGVYCLVLDIVYLVLFPEG